MNFKKKVFEFYRNNVPNFRGKIRLGKLFVKITSYRPISEEPIIVRNNLTYFVPSLKDQIGVELFFHGVYEKDIINFFINKINDGDVYFDIGANIGSLGIPIVKVKKIQYHGFEASPSVFFTLNRNFQLNRINSGILSNKAVADSSDKMLTFIDTSNDRYGEGHLTFASNTTNTITVESICLNDYCNELKIDTINWLKIDVQGHESLVFKGADKLLKEGRVKNILFEFEAWAETMAGYKVGFAKNIIEGYGYRLNNLNGDPWSISDELNNTMIWATI